MEFIGSRNQLLRSCRSDRFVNEATAAQLQNWVATAPRFGAFQLQAQSRVPRSSYNPTSFFTSSAILRPGDYFKHIATIMPFNGDIDDVFPKPCDAEQSTVSYTQKDFKISARKLPISRSGPIDEMSKRLGIPVPEMIFGNNMVSIEHMSSGWCLEFNAFDALDRVDKTDKNMLKVAYSKEWSSSRYG